MKYGRYIRMTPPRIKVGQSSARRQNRVLRPFVAFLRARAAFLAGANRMSWPRFLVFNAAGGMVWAGAYGFSAYFLGTAIHRFVGPANIVLDALAVLIIVAGAVFLSRNEKHLVEEAEKALHSQLRKVARKQT